jgi:hypothetical protein
MHLIADLWWLWLIVFCGTFCYGGYNQIRRMKMITANGRIWDGIYLFLLAALLNAASTVLLVTSLVLNIIDYAKQP